MTRQNRAVVLVSGGLDSATALALAREQGRDCHTLCLDYGQRQRAELRAAERVATALGAREHRCVRLDIGGFGGSALTDTRLRVPDAGQHAAENDIPVTYVPARNTIFLSVALGLAEAIGASEVFIAINAVDYSGYPDCRPPFVEAFQRLVEVATQAGLEGRPIRIRAPLLHWSKADIIAAGTRLGVPYGDTVSCYQPDDEGRACGRCDACALRRAGFQAAGVADPTRYRPGPDEGE